MPPLSKPQMFFYCRLAVSDFGPGRPPGYPPGCPRHIPPKNCTFMLFFASWFYGPYPQYGWDLPEEIPEKFWQDPGSTLRAGIPLESMAGIPQALQFNAFEASRAFPEFSPPQYGWGRNSFFRLETNSASRWKGVRLPRASGSPRTSPEVPPNFPGSFSATSPEVVPLCNLTAIQRFPGSFANLPGSSPNFPGSSRTSPEVSPFLWEA